MKLECIRTDLGNSTDMMMFQRAFIVYLGTNGYRDFTFQLTVDKNGLASCLIEPDLDNTQKNDILQKMQTLKGVADTDTGIEFTFI